MKFRNMWLKYYAQADDGMGGKGAGGGTDGAGAGDEGKGDEGKGKGDEGKGEEGKGEEGKGKGKDGDDKLTDKEAQLLKDLMKHKDNAKTEKAAREALEAKLKEFEGIDPAAVRELLKQKRQAEEEELERKGQWDALKANMAKEHQTEKASLESRIAELTAQLSERNTQIDELTIGSRFSSSEFITKETTIASPAKARALYGAHFDLVDGVLTGFDKPRGAKDRAPLVDASGNALPFDSAMRKIIEADPDKEALLRAKGKQGAGSASTDTSGKDVDINGKESNSVDMIAAGLASLKLG